MVTVYFLSTPPLRWLLYLFLSIPISPSILRFPRSVYRCPYLSKIFKMFLCSTLSFSFSWDRHFDGVTFTWSGTDALEPSHPLPPLYLSSRSSPPSLPAFPPTLYSFLVADGLSHVVDTSQTIVVCVFIVFNRNLSIYTV